MTTQNAGKKEQGMSEVYTSVYDRANQRWNVIGPSKAVVDWFCKDSCILSDNMARACNIAHAHATDAAARRARELENLLGMCEDVLIDIDPEDGEFQRDPQELLAEIKQSLAGKERTDGAN